MPIGLAGDPASVKQAQPWQVSVESHRSTWGLYVKLFCEELGHICFGFGGSWGQCHVDVVRIKCQSSEQSSGEA